MATNKTNSAGTEGAPQASETVASELRIEVYPMGYDEWNGTQNQLKAEGLIPDGLEWPAGAGDERWEAAGFHFWLTRRRPDNFKGPMCAWLNLDNWWLRRTLVERGRDGFAAARLHEKRRALEDELWGRSPAARQQWSKYCKARDDRAFQAFKSRIPALVPPVRGRRPKLAPPAA